MKLLLNGDCLNHLQTIEPNSVDLIFCDLPYGQLSKETCKWDCPIDLDKLWTLFMKIKKLNTPIIMTTTTKFGVSLILSAPKKCPFRYDCVWAKSSSTGALASKKQPLRKHEMIYVFYEKQPFYDLSSHKSKNIDKEEEEVCETAYGKIKIKPPKTAGSRYEPPLPHSLVEIKSTRKKHHTEKPVDLMKWILKYYSKEGDVILDPTMGSGSMGVACEEMKRNFIGIEKDEEIFNVASERLNA
tara:strand:- start:292 stop:1017 length:726 start_codon:yes stop_codon:yes gene_type:complete